MDYEVTLHNTPRQLQKKRNTNEEITEQLPIVSYIRLEYWIALIPLSNIANSLFMRKRDAIGVIYNPPFLHILHGNPHFLSHFQIPDYIADLAIS